MTRVGVITQARMTSTRLPGKVLLEAGGETMLAHHIDRVRSAGFDVYVATTANVLDEPIVAAAENLGCSVFRGSEEDVLSRFTGTAREFDLEVVVRVTSDCPLIDGELVRRGVETFLDLDDPNAFVSNTLERTYPRGFDFEVFSTAALVRADARAGKPGEREHVTPYLYSPSRGNAAVQQVTRPRDASRFRVTLDMPEDFELISRIIEDEDGAEFSAEQIIDLLERKPELSLINAAVEQKKIGP